MEIYSKTKPTELELEEEEFNTSVESYKTQSEFLNTIKEVLELTEYTTEEIISYHENGNKKAVNTFNYLEDSAIINVALYNFLELVAAPSGINFLIGDDFELIEELEYASIKIRTGNLIDSAIESINSNTADKYLEIVKKEVEVANKNEKEFRKEFLESRKKEIEKELAELEAKK